MKADESSINIGDSVEIVGNFGRSTMIKSSGDLNIQDEVFINRGCEIYVTESVTFGYDATIAPNVVIRDSDRHSVGNNKINRGPISIGAGSWVGTECVILNNVTIGEGAVVAAGSVVTKDIPPQTLAAGVPAEPIREVE